jgi:hypothetical protein
VYYVCRGLPYGKEHQTLLIDDEPNKVLWNPKWSGLFLNSFKEQMLSSNKVQWLDLTSRLWPPLVELPLAKMVQVHYDHMFKYSKFCLNFSLINYYCFVQYVDNENGVVRNNQPPLVMHFKSFHYASHYFVIIFLHCICIHAPLFSSIDFCL